MNRSAIWLTAVSVLFFGIVSSPGQSVSAEAKRHFDCGTAAAKMEDFEAAVKAFEQAAMLAPTWPDAVYNLGLAQEVAYTLEGFTEGSDWIRGFQPNEI